MARFPCAPAAAVALPASGASGRNAEPARVADTTKETILVDAKGMTLYVFGRDAADTAVDAKVMKVRGVTGDGVGSVWHVAQP